LIEVIFVHVPKTGGTSFCHSVQSHYGASLYEDYDDVPANPASRFNVDPVGFERAVASCPLEHLDGVRAITGHFWIRKYDRLKAKCRATILRDPIERAISNYFYWLVVDPKFRAINPIIGLMNDPGLTFMEFARVPFINRFYTRCLFRDVDMAVFDYIGTSATLRTSPDTVTGRFGFSTPPGSLRETASLYPGYAERKAEILADPAAMAELRTLFADDLRFFEDNVG
jgi:hypothetical protein